MVQSSSPTSGDPPREFIHSIELGIFSPDEVRRFSVCSICESSMYTNSLPTNFSCVDFRMGSVDRRLKCGTCKRTVTTCPGHFGSINLSFPVLHPGFIDTILKLLRCVCFFCSDLLLGDKEKALVRKHRDRKQRLSAAAAFGKSRKTCLKCAGCQPQYIRSGLSIRCDWSKVSFSDPEEHQYCQRPFTAAEVRLILRHMQDDACTLLCFNPATSRPENFVLTVLVVPPPIVRPSITISEGSRARGQDDLTSKLCDIVKANASVKLVLEKEASSIPRLGLSLTAQQVVAELTFHVSTFMNNELRGQRQSVQRSGLPSKSITSRLKGKEGRIRGSLMGKRVNFSARSVVSPDSQMDIDQVGVPFQVATRLTVPEKVTDRNLDRLRQAVRIGSASLGGAHSIFHDGVWTLMEFADKEREMKRLRPGDTVERYLENEDIVLFNRQPSLHKGSLMGYRVRLMPFRTFRLNMAVTIPLNADCDGDELNVHVPQDEESQVEARLLMGVPCQIVSAQANKPCIGFVQDAVVGSWLLTSDETIVSRAVALELWDMIERNRPVLSAKASFSGKEVYSMLLPVNLEYNNSKTGVCIRKGVLVSGRLCKQTLGATAGGLVHALYLSHGPKRTADFLSDAQRLVNRWLTVRGFSIRLSDCEPSPETRAHVSTIIRLAEQKIQRIQNADAVMSLLPEQAEGSLSEIANMVLTNVGKVVHASLNSKENALYQAVLSASKGNLINVAQLLGCLGQQTVDGKRPTIQDVQQQFGEPKTLGCAGFVAHSLYSGLTDKEFFFHTMAGREGLIDTAVKTANTGYLQRRLMKAMETVTVAYDCTVRNAKQNIVQFLYGGDSFDATYVVRQNLDILLWSAHDLRPHFEASLEWGAFWAVFKSVRSQRLRAQSGEFDTLAYAPGSINDLYAHYLLQSNIRNPRFDAYSDDDLQDRLNLLCDDLCETVWGRKSVLELLLRWYLRVEQLRRLTRSICDVLIGEIRRRISLAFVSPGEAVGALSAQSISEPLTQFSPR